jgi:hypothetical protein
LGGEITGTIITWSEEFVGNGDQLRVSRERWGMKSGNNAVEKKGIVGDGFYNLKCRGRSAWTTA